MGGWEKASYSYKAVEGYEGLCLNKEEVVAPGGVPIPIVRGELWEVWDYFYYDRWKIMLQWTCGSVCWT